MYISETLGRIFWCEDDTYDFKSCPMKLDGTGDFDYWDYVSEWTEWHEVDMNLLFDIHKACIFNKREYAGSITFNGV